ncbi:MAG: hypothetical protein ACFCVE_00335 [Phycisphaerae bacterium]
MPTLEQARLAKQEATREFGHLPQFSGAGITAVAGGYAVRVNFTTLPPTDHPLPDTLTGVPVVFCVVGRARKRPAAGRGGRPAPTDYPHANDGE